MSNRNMIEDGYPVVDNWEYKYGAQAGALIVYEIDEDYFGEGDQDYFDPDKPYVHWKCLACGATSKDKGNHPKRLDRIKTGAIGGKIYATGKYDAGVRSCGCKQKKCFKSANIEGSTISKHQNTTYGDITKIIGETDYTDSNRSKIIICECGICKKPFFSTRRHKTNNCGCLKNQRKPFNLDIYRQTKIIKSKGERHIEKILEKLNVEFSVQKKFIDCLGDNEKTPLPFDFYVTDKAGKKIIIEVDGEQHFTPIEHFGGDDGFKKRRRYDIKKDNYCFNNNIPIIRFPYSEVFKIKQENFVTFLNKYTITPENEKEYYESRV